MKRRRSSESNPKDPSQIRSSFLRGFHGVRSSENSFGPSDSCGTEDICRGKSVKFTDPETDLSPSSRSDASAISHEGSEAPSADGPKTSEYAFFKKLKKHAGRTFHSCPLRKESKQLKKFESSDRTGEMTNNVTPINLESSPSPLGSPSKNSEITNMVKHKFENHKSSLLIEKVSPRKFNSFPSSIGGPANNSGTQYWHEEVFSTKRRRLCQQVADTSSPEIDELCSKGLDTSPCCCRDPKFKQPEIVTESEFLPFLESDADFDKLHWTITSNFMEPKHTPYMDDGSLACWSDSSKKVALSKWDSVGCDSPTSHANKTYFQYKIREFDCDLDDGRTARLYTENDSAFGFSFEKYRSLASNHLKELDEFLDPNENALGRQPHTPLLGWNFDNMKDEQCLSVTSHKTELSMYPTLPTSRHEDQWQSVDNRFDASALCLPSFLSNCPPDFNSSPHFCSSSYHDLDFERPVLEDNNDTDAELNHFPLTLSCTPNYLNLAEDCNYDTTCRGSSIFPSPQNHHWFMSKVFSGKCHPRLEAHLIPSGLDFDSRLKSSAITDSSWEHQSSTYHDHRFPRKDIISSYCLPEDEFGSLGETLNQHAKDILSIHDWSSISFQKGLPLLLDKSSSDGFEEETYFDDSDVKYI